MSFNSLAPVLSAQVIRDPTGRPRATFGRYSIIPRALTARVFGAGTKLRLLSSQRHERDLFAQRSAFCDCDLVAFRGGYAGRVVRERLAPAPLVPAILRVIVK